MGLHADYYTSSNLAKYPFEVYWPREKLKVGFLSQKEARIESISYELLVVFVLLYFIFRKY